MTARVTLAGGRSADPGCLNIFNTNRPFPEEVDRATEDDFSRDGLRETGSFVGA